MEHYAALLGESGHPTVPQKPGAKTASQDHKAPPAPPLQPLAASSVLAGFEWLGCLPNVAEQGSWLHFLFPTGPCGFAVVGGPYHYSHSYPRGSQPSNRHVCGLLQMGHAPSAPATNHVGTPIPAVDVWMRLVPSQILPQRVSVQGKVVLDSLHPAPLPEPAEPVFPPPPQPLCVCGGIMKKRQP